MENLFRQLCELEEDKDTFVFFPQDRFSERVLERTKRENASTIVLNAIFKDQQTVVHLRLGNSGDQQEQETRASAVVLCDGSPQTLSAFFPPCQAERKYITVVLRQPDETSQDGQTAVHAHEEDKPHGSLVTVLTSYKGKVKILPVDNVLVQPSREHLYARNRGILETGVLAMKQIGVVDLGPIGAEVALEAAKGGVGKIVIVDNGRITAEEVQGHVATLNDVGRLRTVALSEILRNKNPFIQIEMVCGDVASQRTSQLLSECDVIVCGSLSPSTQNEVNAICVQNKRPAIYVNSIRGSQVLEVLRVRPNHPGPCTECQQSVVHRPSTSKVSTEIDAGHFFNYRHAANLLVKLAFVELSKDAGKQREEDTTASVPATKARGLDRLDEAIGDTALFMWMNYPNNQGKNTLGNGATLRWFGFRGNERKQPGLCSVCDE